MAGSLAGCGDGSEDADPTASDGRDAADGDGGTEPTRAPSSDGPSAEPVERSLPLADERPHLGHSTEVLDDHNFYGGVDEDGIPSIDDPVFADPADADVDEGDPVFGPVPIAFVLLVGRLLWLGRHVQPGSPSVG